MMLALLARLLMPLAAAAGAIALVSPAHSAIAPSAQTAADRPLPGLIAQEPILQTVLYFETDTMAVRIQGRGNDLFMNLYWAEPVMTI